MSKNTNIYHNLINYLNIFLNKIYFIKRYEYAVSSSLMIIIIAMLFGCYDLCSILLIGGINACMNFFGLFMEEFNILKQNSETNWLPFIFGSFAGLMPWIVILIYFLGGGNYDLIPGFVYGIFACYIFFFNTFPVNMFLQYKKWRQWKDYIFGE